MSKFKPGLRVVVIDGDTHEIRKGVINASYEDVGIAIVKFDDGNVEKVDFDYLGIESEIKAHEEKPTESREDLVKIIEETEITLIETDFMRIVVDNARNMSKGDELVKLMLLSFGAKLHKALFYDRVKND